MSSYGNNWQSFDDEEEEEIEFEENEPGEFQFSEKDTVIFAIDASPKMQELDEDGISHFNGALRCAVRFLQGKIVQSETDFMGLVFFGTEKHRNQMNFEHIQTYYELDVPDVDRILGLEKLEKSKSQFEKEIGSSDDYSLAEVLWTCSNLFSAGSPKNSTKRIFLITHNDNPNVDNANLQRNARVRAQDLSDLGISIELFPVEVDMNKPFDFQAFYKDLPAVTGGGEEENLEVPSASRKYEEMQKKILRKEVKKRTAFRVPFKLADGVEIGVKGYNLFVEQKKGNFTRLLAKTNAEVRTVSSWSTAQLLLPTDIKLYWTYGGAKAIFTKEEVNEIKYFGDPGLVLLGFKDRHALKFKHNIKHSSFIYPDEGAYAGGTSLFANLLDRLERRGKIAICRLIARKNSAPRLVALVPQKGTINRNGDETPYGFHVIFLPYADDNRHIPAAPVEPGSVPEAHQDVGQALVAAINIKNFDVSNYDNPVLQKHYANLQALALKKDFADEVE
ncbi:X-ray repair cross-complementing protein 6, partial [Borealophlyctis nickersoniae]